MRPAEDGDALQRFVFERARVRGELVRLDRSWQEVLRRHAFPVALQSALGELMAACALLSATLKFEGGALVLQIQGGGPVSLLVVECQSDLTMRAAATWDASVEELGESPSLRALTSGGRCVLTIDPGPGRPAHQSVVPLEGLRIGDLLHRYMVRSEQLETRFALAADSRRASGLLLQKLPEKGGRLAPEHDTDLWDRAVHLVQTLTREELLGLPGPEILRRLFHREMLRVFESMPVRFGCRCSRDRVGGVLRMIGAAEVQSILAEQGELAVTCEFCRERYVFTPDEAQDALRDLAAGTPPPA